MPNGLGKLVPWTIAFAAGWLGHAAMPGVFPQRATESALGSQQLAAATTTEQVTGAAQMPGALRNGLTLPVRDPENTKVTHVHRGTDAPATSGSRAVPSPAGQDARAMWASLAAQYAAAPEGDIRDALQKAIDESPDSARFAAAQKAMTSDDAAVRRSAYLWLAHQPAQSAVEARSMLVAALGREADAEALRTLLGVLAHDASNLSPTGRAALVERITVAAQGGFAQTQTENTALASDALMHLARLDGPRAGALIQAQLTRGEAGRNHVHVPQALRALRQIGPLDSATQALVTAIADDAAQTPQARQFAQQLLKGNHCTDS
jgi:hypothetical protein